jgi:hypothetical protein
MQATITLTLTQEQLLTLLNAAPAQAQTAAPTPTLARMFAQPVAAPMPQAQPMQTPAPMPQAQPTPAQMPQVQPTPAPMPTQTAPQTYSVTDLGLAARPLMENGRQQELIALIAEFGVPSIAAIPENRRTEFAARLRSLGGQI